MKQLAIIDGVVVNIRSIYFNTNTVYYDKNDSSLSRDLSDVILLKNSGIMDNNNCEIIESHLLLFKQYAVSKGVAPRWKLKVVSYNYGGFNINETNGAQSEFYILGFSSELYDKYNELKGLMKDNYNSLDIYSDIKDEFFVKVLTDLGMTKIIELIYPTISEKEIEEGIENILIHDHWSAWCEDNEIKPYELWRKDVPSNVISIIRDDVIKEKRKKLL